MILMGPRALGMGPIIDAFIYWKLSDVSPNCMLQDAVSSWWVLLSFLLHRMRQFWNHSLRWKWLKLAWELSQFLKFHSNLPVANDFKKINKQYIYEWNVRHYHFYLSIYLYWCAVKALTIMTSVRKRGVSTVSRESVSRKEKGEIGRDSGEWELRPDAGSGSLYVWKHQAREPEQHHQAVHSTA